MLISKAHDDLRHAQKKRLGPELEQLSLEFGHVPLILDFCRGLELYPVDWDILSFRLAVPD